MPLEGICAETKEDKLHPHAELVDKEVNVAMCADAGRSFLLQQSGKQTTASSSSSQLGLALHSLF